MAGFGSISLAQTAVGTLLDQRAVVLYKQPKEDIKELSKIKLVNDVISDLWGSALQYEELFAGIANEFGSSLVNRLTNISGTNPYGITYISAKVNIDSDLCDHPIETGKILTDARVIQPVSAQVEVAMPTFFAERIYKTMNDMQKSVDDKMILQTKYRVYKNLVLQSFGYSLDNNTVDRTVFTLMLREVMEVAPYGEFDFKAADQLKNASDSNTVSNGTQVAGV